MIKINEMGQLDYIKFYFIPNGILKHFKCTNSKSISVFIYSNKLIKYS